MGPKHLALGRETRVQKFSARPLWSLTPPATICARVQVRGHSHLQTHDNGVQVQHGLPVLPQYIQTHVPLEVNVRMVDLLSALYFRRVVRKVLVDGEAEAEGSSFIHAFVRLDGQGEIHDIVVGGEIGAHRCAKGKF